MNVLGKILALGALSVVAACTNNDPSALGGGAGGSGSILPGSPSDPRSPAYFQQTVGDRVLFEVDQSSLLAMANYRYCPEPLTLFKSVRKLEPGHLLTVHRDGAHSTRRFYSVSFEEPGGREDPGEQSEALLEVLRDATRRQMVADVEVGLFLSGGVDSSALLALAGAGEGRRLKTFTIGFRAEDQRGEGQPDDVGYARKMARQFDTTHSEIILDPKVVESLPEVVWHLDEPIADPGRARELGAKYVREYFSTVVEHYEIGGEHFRGTKDGYSTEEVISLFLKYNEGDDSWKEDAEWEKLTF